MAGNWRKFTRSRSDAHVYVNLDQVLFVEVNQEGTDSRLIFANGVDLWVHAKPADVLSGLESRR